MQLPLQPNQPLKSASHSWFSQQIRTVYTHIELDIIALDSHLAQFLTSENVLKIHKIHDFAHQVSTIVNTSSVTIRSEIMEYISISSIVRSSMASSSPFLAAAIRLLRFFVSSRSTFTASLSF